MVCPDQRTQISVVSEGKFFDDSLWLLSSIAMIVNFIRPITVIAVYWQWASLVYYRFNIFLFDWTPLRIAGGEDKNKKQFKT